MSVVQHTSIWQRLRVAMIGLVIVSTAIFGANALIDQASDDPDLAGANVQQDLAKTGGENIIDETPSEPLVELGVTPVPKDDNLRDDSLREDNSGQPAEVTESEVQPVSEDEVFSTEDDGLLIGAE